jgi:hypothetical protein
MDEIPVPYEIVKKTDHYFLLVPGFNRICIAGNHDKHRHSLTKPTIGEINKLVKKIKASADE